MVLSRMPHRQDIDLVRSSAIDDAIVRAEDSLSDIGPIELGYLTPHLGLLRQPPHPSFEVGDVLLSGAPIIGGDVFVDISEIFFGVGRPDELYSSSHLSILPHSKAR